MAPTTLGAFDAAKFISPPYHCKRDSQWRRGSWKSKKGRFISAVGARGPALAAGRDRRKISAVRTSRRFSGFDAEQFLDTGDGGVGNDFRNPAPGAVEAPGLDLVLLSRLADLLAGHGVDGPDDFQLLPAADGGADLDPALVDESRLTGVLGDGLVPFAKGLLHRLGQGLVAVAGGALANKKSDHETCLNTGNPPCR